MKFFRLTVDSDNGFQTIADAPELFNKDLYTPYKRDFTDGIHLDLDKGKKKTDVLNMGDLTLHGFPIQNQFADLIRNCNLENVQFVKITSKDLEDYQFLFFNGDLTPKLDYAKSNLIFIQDVLGDIEELDINVPKNRSGAIKTHLKFIHESTFNQMVPKNGYHFVAGFDINTWDVFRIGHFDKSFYISEKLKHILEGAKMTGVNFRESDLFNRPEPEIDKKSGWRFW